MVTRQAESIGRTRPPSPRLRRGLAAARPTSAREGRRAPAPVETVRAYICLHEFRGCLAGPALEGAMKALRSAKPSEQEGVPHFGDGRGVRQEMPRGKPQVAQLIQTASCRSSSRSASDRSSVLRLIFKRAATPAARSARRPQRGAFLEHGSDRGRKRMPKPRMGASNSIFRMAVNERRQRRGSAPPTRKTETSVRDDERVLARQRRSGLGA